MSFRVGAYLIRMDTRLRGYDGAADQSSTLVGSTMTNRLSTIRYPAHVRAHLTRIGAGVRGYDRKVQKSSSALRADLYAQTALLPICCPNPSTGEEDDNLTPRSPCAQTQKYREPPLIPLLTRHWSL